MNETDKDKSWFGLEALPSGRCLETSTLKVCHDGLEEVWTNSPNRSELIHLLHIYIRILFMSEFPGLRRIVKIRDFDPYLRARSACSTNKKSMKCLNLHTLQIRMPSLARHSSDQYQWQGLTLSLECQGHACQNCLDNDWSLPTLQILCCLNSIDDLQSPVWKPEGHSSDPA